MADNVELKSLVSIASVKGSATRESGESRFRTSSASASRGKGGFDGLLKTFLGDDKSSTKRMGLSRGRNGANAKALESASAKAGQGKGAKNSGSLEDIETVEDASEENGAQAAREAARRMWELLYGATNAGMLDATELSAEAGDPMGQIADAIASQTGVGAMPSELARDGLNIRSMPETLDLTNANAQGNAEAVLAEAEDVINGMTGDELDALLTQAIDEEENTPFAYEDEESALFSRMAEELDLEVLSVGGGESDLLASLASGAAYTGAPSSSEEAAPAADNLPGTAGISGTNDAESNAVEEWTELFEKFIEEKAAGDPTLLSESATPENGRKLLDSFAQWLADNGKASESKQLSEHPNKFIQSLISGLSASASKTTAANGETLGKNEIFIQAQRNLESVLQNTSDVKANEAPVLPTGEATQKLNQGIFEETYEPGLGVVTSNNPMGHEAAGQGIQQSIPSLARSDSSNPAAMSTMLDQIENVERIAEAMKMANKNGVKNLTVQLSPVELGKVVLRVESRDGVVSAHLRVEKPETVAQLGTNLQQLRENLKAAGIELGEVTIEQRGGNETLGDFSGQRRQQGEGAEEPANRVHWRRGGADRAAAGAEQERRPSSGGGLDLVA